MTTQTNVTHEENFILVWILMLFISGLATLNHMMLPLYDVDNVVLSIGWIAFSLYATLVIAIPYRQREKWAWYATWISVIVFALPIVLITGEALNSEMVGVGYAYLIGSGLMAFGQLVTRPAFFWKD